MNEENALGLKSKVLGEKMDTWVKIQGFSDKRSRWFKVQGTWFKIQARDKKTLGLKSKALGLKSKFAVNKTLGLKSKVFTIKRNVWFKVQSLKMFDDEMF